MARMILIAEDSPISRMALAAGLQDEYSVIEAADGKEAMALIHRHYRQLAAVLLDIGMPVMDGYEVLRQIRRSPILTQLPVIVITGSEDEGARLKALECGANDFVQKPFNPDIIKHCLKNNIALRETASIINAIQRDKLTGIYNREYFFEKAGELIRRAAPGSYVLACLDIDNFKLINDQYGASEGDRILQYISAQMQRTFNDVQGICGRISGDNFAVLFPNSPDAAEYVAKQRETTFIPPNTPASLHFSVGRYVVSDLSLPVSALYDRAYIAKQSVKGRYDTHMTYFNESMLQALVLEQEIIGEMDRALRDGEFEVWLQPQYNHATGALIGAEALARWRHPSKGLISPGDFIPVFEENGFIYELDKYVWEGTCRCLRRWLDEGRDPLPVSVNVSRYDVFRSDLISVITGLLEKYGVPVELLRLEVTESAFSEAAEQINATVKRLIELGFTVEIDDFGSGYSSLNILKDVPAQVLKLDMRFLEGSASAQRSGSILESVTRMARWIGMAVIAEGVETVEQADFLRSIGCNYVQGYLYERPMPIERYEQLARQAAKEERLISFESVVTLDSDSFWDPSSLDTLVFNSFVGGACIFEACNGAIDLLRVNGNYVRELGISCAPGAPLDELDPFKYIDEAGKQTVRGHVNAAVACGEEQTFELTLRDDGAHFERPQCVSCSFRVIAKAGDRELFYCVMRNITSQAEANEQLRFLNDMAHELLAQPDVEEGLQSVLRRLMDYFDGARAYIFEFDFERDTASNTYEVCAQGVSREKENLQSIPLEIMSFWLETFKKEDYLAIDSVDALKDDRAAEREVLRAQKISSIFAVPLHRDGKLIGMIGIDDPRRQYAQMSHMVALGDYIAVMLTRRDLNSQLAGEDRELMRQLQTPRAGLREVKEKTHARRRLVTPRTFLFITLALCMALIGFRTLCAAGRPGSGMDSFSETVLTLSDGWTLTDSEGGERSVTLPLTIDHGANGEYTLTGTLPAAQELIDSPALCIYSNYVDMRVELDGETLMAYPNGEPGRDAATGNTYHFIRLPTGYEGKTLAIKLRCQLGDDITYLLKAPVIGSKATMLRTGVAESMPFIMLAGCMLVLALVLATLHLFLRRRLSLNSATAYTALFAILFACYVFCETYFAQLLAANPYALFSATLLLLALLPMPLVGLFAEEVSSRFKNVPLWLMALCAVNFTAQLLLNCAGIKSLRVMLPATHTVIVASIAVMAFCLLFSDRSEKPSARKTLRAALPMVAGGIADIVLLTLNRPSFNNSLWFTIGVTAFILIQFCGYVRSFFVMYRLSLEASVLRDMAYRDTLTSLGNRNAYERRLKELTEKGLSERLCCIVIDINDLKQINDRYGHSVGDAAIVETSRILSEYVPGSASCYRVGGDEFIVLLNDFDEARAEILAGKLGREAKRRGERYHIPLSLAIGCGRFEPEDGSILDFIRRVDALMYGRKKSYKDSESYPFKRG